MDILYRLSSMEGSYQEEICEKLIQLSFAKIVNSKSERGGAKLHKNLLVLHLLQMARWEQRNRLFQATASMDVSNGGDYGQSNRINESEEHTQTDRLIDSDEGAEDGENLAHKRTEIDETFCQQTRAENEMATEGAFSACCYHRLTSCSSCPRLNSTPAAQFDGSYSETTLERQDQAPSQQLDENGATFFHSSDKRERKLDSQDLPTQQPTKNGSNSRQRRRNRQHRRRSHSANARRSVPRTSSLSLSDGSTEISYFQLNTSNYPDTENGDHKRRDCVKRKLEEPVQAPLALQSVASFDWYSSPKMACLDSHVGQTLQCEQHQSLNGLISVLASSDQTKLISIGEHEENKELALTVRMFETGENDSSPLTRSISCPGLMELACES